MITSTDAKRLSRVSREVRHLANDVEALGTQGPDEIGDGGLRVCLERPLHTWR